MRAARPLAIPSNAVQNSISAIMEKGYVPRPYLGVSIFDQQSAARYGYQLNLKKGVYLSQVVPGGPADKAGLRQGDVIADVRDQSVESLADFYRKVWASGPAGAEIPVRVIREGRDTWLRIKSADRSSFLRKPMMQ